MAEDVTANIGVNVNTSDAISSIKKLQREIAVFNAQLATGSKTAANKAANLNQELINSVNSTGKFAASMTSVKSSTEAFSTALEKNKLSMGQYFRYSMGSTRTFGNFFKKEFSTIQKVAIERVKDLQTQYISMGRDANGALKAIKIRPLALDMQDLATKTMVSAQKMQIMNQLVKQGSTQLLNWGKNTQWAGRQLMVGFTIPLTMFAAAAAKSFMDIEKQIVKIRRVYGDFGTTVQETDKMIESIKSLAGEYTKYGVAVKDTLNLASEAAAMGKTGAELLGQVAQATRLAVLGNVEQTQALETTISLTNTFGTTTDKLAGKIDFLNAVENQSVTSIEDLTIAIPKAGPVVQQLGGDVEDLAFFLTAMKEGGINASEGANALKSGLAALINPTGKAKDMLAGFGINIEKIVNSNKGDIKGLVIDFASALDTLDPLSRARAIEQLFGKFQFSRLSTLFQNVIGEGTQASRVLELTKSTTQELAILSKRELSKIENTTTYKFEKAFADFQASIAPVGEEFLKLITPVIEFGTKLLQQFNNMDAGVKQFIVGLTVVLGGIFPALLMTVGLFANGIANILKLVGSVSMMFRKTSGDANVLGNQFGYMTQAELQAAAAAASLDQVHSKLHQTFTAEKAAVDALTTAYQRNIAAQRGAGAGGAVGRKPKPAKFASGIVSVPGPKGAGDIVPAMLSPGEAVIPAGMAKKYGGLINGMVSGKIPGYQDGNVTLKGYTNAVHLTSPAGNADKFNPQDLAKELRLGEGKAFAPIVHEVARQLGGTSQAQIQKIVQDSPEIIDVAKRTNEALAKELSKAVGNIDQTTYSEMWQKHLREQANTLDDATKKALDRVLTQTTTVEDSLHLRERGKGNVEARGRTGIISGVPSYRDQRSAYLSTAAMFGGGTLPPTTVLAHGTMPSYQTMEQHAGGRPLSGTGQGVASLLASGQTSIGLRGRPGESVIVSTAELKALTAQLGGNLTAAVKQILSEAVAGLRDITKTASPSQEMHQIGADIGQGAINGINSKVSDAAQAGENVGQAAANGTQSVADRKNRRVTKDTGGPIIVSQTGTKVRSSSKKEPRRVSRPAPMNQNIFTPTSGISSVPYGPAPKKPGIGSRIASGVKGMGTGMGAGMGVAMAGGALAMIPGLEGLGTAAGLAGSAMMMIPGPIGLVVAGLIGMVGIIMSLNAAQEEQRRKTIEIANASTMSIAALNKMAEDMGTVSATQAREAEMSAKLTNVKEEELSAGQQYLKETESGKALLSGVQKQQAAGATTVEISDDVAKNLAIAVAQNVITKEQGSQIIAALGIQSGNLGISSGASKQFNAYVADLTKTAGSVAQADYAKLSSLTTTAIGKIDYLSSKTGGQSAAGTAQSNLANDVGTQTINAYGRSVGGTDSINAQYDALVASAKTQKEISILEANRKIDLAAQVADQGKLYDLVVKQKNAVSETKFNEAFLASVKQTFGETSPAYTTAQAINALGNSTFKTRIQTQLESGTLSPESINVLMDYASKNKGFGAAYDLAIKTAGEVETLNLVSSLQSAGSTVKTQTLMLNIVSGGDYTAEQLAEAATAIEWLNTNGEVNIDVNADNGEVLKTFANDVENINGQLKRNGNKFSTELIAKYTGSDEAAKALKDNKAFNKLSKVNKVRYLAQYHAVFSSARSGNDMGYLGWKKFRQAAGKSYSEADYAAAVMAKAAISSTSDSGGSTDSTDTTGGGGGGTKEDKKLAKYNKAKDKQQKALNVIALKEDAINKVYDKRRKALEEIAKINSQIAEQQKDQLDVAIALTSGDISAAARAVQAQRIKAASYAQEEQIRALEAKRQAELDGIIVNGKTREAYEAEIARLNLLIAERELALATSSSSGGGSGSGSSSSGGSSDSSGSDPVVTTTGPPGAAIVPWKKDESKYPSYSAHDAGYGMYWKWSKDYKEWMKNAKPKVGTLARGQEWAWANGRDEWFKRTVEQPVMVASGGLIGYSMGGRVANRYLASGGSLGSDTIPAMLTPGEFVVKRPAVQNFGVKNLQAINSGKSPDGSVYTYNVTVNAGGNASADDIARTVMTKIKQVDGTRLRGNRL